MEKVKINFYLKTEAFNATAFIAFCRAIIIQLAPVSEVFTTVGVWDNLNKKNYSFKEDLSDFTPDALKLIIIEDREIAYLNPDIKTKTLTALSKSWAGFTSSFTFGANDIFMTVAQGSYDGMQAFIEFEFGDQFQDKATEKFIINLIEVLVEIVDLSFANVISNKFLQKIRRKGFYSIGWINFTNDKSLGKFLSKKEFRKELNKGLIFSLATKDLCNEDNSTSVTRAIEISDLLAEKYSSR